MQSLKCYSLVHSLSLDFFFPCRIVSLSILFCSHYHYFFFRPHVSVDEISFPNVFASKLLIKCDTMIALVVPLIRHESDQG